MCRYPAPEKIRYAIWEITTCNASHLQLPWMESSTVLNPGMWVMWKMVVQVSDGFCITQYNDFLVKALLLSCFWSSELAVSLHWKSVGLQQQPQPCWRHRQLVRWKQSRHPRRAGALQGNGDLHAAWSRRVRSSWLREDDLYRNVAPAAEVMLEGRWVQCLLVNFAFIPLGLFVSGPLWPVAWHVLCRCFGEILERGKEHDSRWLLLFLLTVSLFFAELKWVIQTVALVADTVRIVVLGMVFPWRYFSSSHTADGNAQGADAHQGAVSALRRYGELLVLL